MKARLGSSTGKHGKKPKTLCGSEENKNRRKKRNNISCGALGLHCLQGQTSGKQDGASLKGKGVKLDKKCIVQNHSHNINQMFLVPLFVVMAPPSCNEHRYLLQKEAWSHTRHQSQIYRMIYYQAFKDTNIGKPLSHTR